MAREEGFGIAGGFAVLVEDLKRENGSPIYCTIFIIPPSRK
jgi:hypothetical protein